MRFGEDGFVTAGFYRTRGGRVVAILGPHPADPDKFITPAWAYAKSPFHWYWTTGVSPLKSENDLIERIEPKDG